MAKKDIIIHQLDGVSVLQRESDGFINGTAMCKACSKLIAHYRENTQTKDYLKVLSESEGIAVDDLIQAVKGGRSQQGTWVHPKVAIHLAQWLSPEFSVQVTNLVFSWMNGGASPQQPALPPKRRILNAHLVLVWSDDQVESTDLSDESLNYALSHVRPESVVLSHKRVAKVMKPTQEGLAAGLSLWGDLVEMVQKRGATA